MMIAEVKMKALTKETLKAKKNFQMEIFMHSTGCTFLWEFFYHSFTFHSTSSHSAIISRTICESFLIENFLLQPFSLVLSLFFSLPHREICKEQLNLQMNRSFQSFICFMRRCQVSQMKLKNSPEGFSRK